VLPVNDRIAIPLREIDLSFARSGGPGGQNVNKVETQVEVRWTPGTSAALSADDRTWVVDKLHARLTNDGELIIVSSRFRTQGANRQDALDRLADVVRQALHRPRKRKKTKPSKAAKQRRIQAKKSRSQTKAARGRVRGDD
jgi:ribosome-associated protein